MYLGFKSLIASRYLRSKRKEVFISIITIISILGVALSVAVLDVVLAIMTGFEAELQKKLISATAHITLTTYNGAIENWQTVARDLLKTSGVISASPYTYSPAMLSTQYGARGILVRGIPEQSEGTKNLKQMLEANSQISDLFHPKTTQVERPDGVIDKVTLPSIIIGRELREKLGLEINSIVTLLSPQLNASPQGLVPRLRRFKVVGSYASGLVEFESGLAYIDLVESQKFFALGDIVSGIEISISDLFLVDEITAQLRTSLDKFENAFRVISWKDANKPLWDALKLEKTAYFYVLLLLILIASFSIVSTLIMVVMEKSKDIAVLKSIGATDRTILGIFLLQSSLIAIAGIILGTVLGVIGCLGLREYGFDIDKSVFSIDKVPVYIIPSNFAVVMLAAFLITSLAGIYPARRAAKIRPADVFRYE